MIESLPFVKYSNRKNLPAIAGVYFAVTDQVDYIGESYNLRKRWANHPVISKLDAPPLIYYLMMPGASKAKRCQCEREQIRRFRPQFNQRGFKPLFPAHTNRGADQWTIKDGAELRRLFAQKGCERNEQLAEALGVSRNAITNWFLHGKPLYNDNAHKVAAFLDTSLDDLFVPRNERYDP